MQVTQMDPMSGAPAWRQAGYREWLPKLTLTVVVVAITFLLSTRATDRILRAMGGRDGRCCSDEITGCTC